MIRILLLWPLQPLKQWLKDRRIVPIVVGLVLVVATIGYASYMQNKRYTVDPATYKQLLDLIGKAESKGNYNAYFGNVGNASIKFTDMSIAEVMKWQSDHVRRGGQSSAVGKYQIIDTTLTSLVNILNIDTDQKFDAGMQDRLAIALIERRGADAYINSEITGEHFAHNLSKEWAGLPKVTGDKPHESYYASDGLNKAQVSVDDVIRAVNSIKPKK